MEEEPQVKQAQPEDAAVPRRRYRWFYIMAVATGLLLCLGLIGWFAILPKVVEKRLVESLRGLGFREVSLRVDHVGMDRARISQVRLGGNQPMVIGSIVATYEFSEAMGGVVKGVEIENLELEAVQDEDGLRFPLLENLRLPESDEPLGRLPFDKISIRNAVLNVTTAATVARTIPFQSSFAREGDLEMAVEWAAPEHDARAQARIEFRENRTVIRGGTFAWNVGRVTVPRFDAPWRDVSLAVSFEGEVRDGVGSISILPGSRFSARSRRVPMGDGLEAEEAQWTGSVSGEPWVFTSGTEGIKYGGFTGQVVAEALDWEMEAMRLRARDLKADVFSSGAGLKLHVKPGTKLDWRPTAKFLASHGLEARELGATLRDLKQPLDLDLPADGNWTAAIAGARLDVRARGMSLPEGNLSLGLVNASLNLRMDASRDGGQMFLESEGDVHVETVEHKAAGKTEGAMGPVAWRLAEDGGRPLLAWGEVTKLEFAARLLAEVVQFQQGETQLEVRPWESVLSIDGERLELVMGRETRARLVPDLGDIAHRGVEAGSASVTMEELGGPIRFTRTHAGGDWLLTAPDLGLALNATAVVIGEPGLDIDSFKAGFRLGGILDEQGLSLTLREPARVETGGIKVSQKDDVTLIRAKDWSIRPEPGRPLLKLGTGDGMEPDFNAQVAGREVRVDSSDFSALFNKVTFRRHYINADDGLQEGTLAFEGGQVEINGLDLKMSGLEGSILRSGGRISGDFTIGKTIAAGDVFPEIKGGLEVDGGTVRVGGKCEIIEDLNATFRVFQLGEAWWLDVKIPRSRIHDPEALGRRFGALKSLELNGTVELQASVKFLADDTFPQFSLELIDADASVVTGDFSALVEGVTLELLMKKHGPGSPMVAPLATRATIRRAQLGALELVNGLIVFRVDESGILIDEERWSLAQDPEGRFWAKGIRLAEGQPVQARVNVERLDLGIWLGLLTGGQVEATGKLSGHVPVKLAGNESNLPVLVGDGAILKTVGAGRLQFKSAKWAGDWLESVDPRFKTDPLLRELRQGVVEALQDFTYSSIEFAYDAKADRLRVAVSGEGKTKAGRVVKFEPTINIQPVASWVNESYNELVLLAHLENLVNRDLDDLFGD